MQYGIISKKGAFVNQTGGRGAPLHAHLIFCEKTVPRHNICRFMLDNCLITRYNYFVYRFAAVMRRNVCVIDNCLIRGTAGAAFG